MVRSLRALSAAGLAVVGAILACSLTPPAATPTPQAPSESPAVTTASNPGVAATPAPPSATTAIVHKTMPGSPGSASAFLTDADSQPFAAQKRAIGDSFDISLFERPFTATSMTYQPFLDIKRAEISSGSPWLYVTIFLQKGPEPSNHPTYAVELDVNLDGRGDWLITAAPRSKDWSAEGVRIYQDADHDVGGAHPLQPDAPPQKGDGYEKLVFDGGNGPDPDAAWARVAPSNPDHIEIAFNPTAVGSPAKFLWGVWAEAGAMHPEWFDYNDHWTLVDAGSPLQGSPDYPPKQLASVDNTCRWGFGFTPSGNEPGICPVPQTPTPVPQHAPGTPTPTWTQIIP